MKTSQNVLNMSTVSRDTNRDGDATDWRLQQQSDGETFCIRLTVFVSVLQDVIKINVLGKGVTQASLEVQLQLCPHWTQE